MGQADFPHTVENDLGNLRAEVVLSAEDTLHCIEQLPSGIRLQNVSMRSGAENLHHHLLRIMHRENEHFRIRTQLQHLFGRLDPVQLRHGHIENGHIRLKFLRHLDSLPPVGSLSATSIPPTLDQISHSRPHDLMIVRNQHRGLLLSHTKSLAADEGR